MKYIFFFLLLCHAAVFSQVPESYNGFISKKDNAYFFYEVRNDSLLPPRYVVFTDTDTIGLNDIITYKGGWVKEQRHIGISGNKKDTTKVNYKGFPYEKITVSGVGPYTMGHFVSRRYNRIKQAERDTIMEGYYRHRFEGIVFFPITDRKINLNFGWTVFQGIDIDSINYANYGKLRQGVYMKLKGKVKYGNPSGYGHFGMSAFEFRPRDIIEMDTTRLLSTHLARDLETEPIVHLGDTIRAPIHFSYGNKYRYVGKFKKYTVQIIIEKSAPGQLDYTLKYYKNNKIHSARSGKLVLNSYYHFMVFDISYNYEEFRRKELHGYEPDTELVATFIDMDRSKVSFSFIDRMFSKKEAVTIELEPVKN